MVAVQIGGKLGMDAVSAIALPRLDRSRLAAAQVFELLRERIISLELSPERCCRERLWPRNFA